MNLFYILVIAIVTFSIIYVASEIMVMPKEELEKKISISVIESVNNPNTIKTYKVSSKKGTVISNKFIQDLDLLEEYKNILILFRVDQSLSKKISVSYNDVNTNYIIFNSSIYYENMQVVCNSAIMYASDLDINNIKSYSYVCEVIFGSKISAIINQGIQDRNILSDINLGVNSIRFDYNITNNYKIRYFIFDNYSKISLTDNSIYFLQNKELNNYGSKDLSNSIDVNFNKIGNQILLIVVSKRDSSYDKFKSNFILSPISYQYFYVNVKKDYNELVSLCKALEIEKQYLDLDNDMCKVKYTCSGCLLPYMCEDAWNNMGYTNIESSQSDYAIGYIDKEECSS